MMAVNVKSALYGMQAIVPHFKQRGRGHLINVSSFLRGSRSRYRSAYNAAKAALNALTANLRMDLRREHPGVHVSLVMPGMVTTEFARNALGGTPRSRGHPAPAAAAQDPERRRRRRRDRALIGSPREELYTQPGQPDTVSRYYRDVGAFERASARVGQAPSVATVVEAGVSTRNRVIAGRATRASARRRADR